MIKNATILAAVVYSLSCKLFAADVQPPASQFKSAQEHYERMNAVERSLMFYNFKGEMLVGSSTTEKSDTSSFCRKHGAVVPEPVYSYECFNIMTNMDPDTARKTYSDLHGKPLIIRAEPSFGMQTREKRTSNMLCRKMRMPGVDAPNQYACYMPETYLQ